MRKSIETIFKGFPKTTQEKRLSEFGFVENKKLLNTVQAEQIGSFNWSVPRQPARESHSVHWGTPSQPPRQAFPPSLSKSQSDFERQRKLHQTMSPRERPFNGGSGKKLLFSEFGFRDENHRT